MNKPSVLSPAGSFEALVSAVNAGADEVYFGAMNFNAREGAKNFTHEQLEEGIKLCRLLGVKTNITVNTLLTDRELPSALDLVYDLMCMGADAFIVQDLGLASVIKKALPGAKLHASTQCACHSLEGARKLSSLGFSRIVLAREMPKDLIKQISDSGIETEIFVHGALCVCHSGMCLMSSVIGKRSGNRGACAQPCRLPYSLDENKKMFYPLSLKDLSLSQNIEDVIDCGATSLKIEGRMKSPEYVYGVTKIWRDLIDSEENATNVQMKKLENLFSRDGFTNKYFSGAYTFDNRDMYGVRRENDKQNTAKEQATITQISPRKRNVSMFCKLEQGKQALLEISCDGVSAKVTLDFVCEKAQNAGVSRQSLCENLSKLGNTPFCVLDKDIKTHIVSDVFVSKSAINGLRRSAVEALEKKLLETKEVIYNKECIPQPPKTSNANNKAGKAKIHISMRDIKNIPPIYDNEFLQYVSVSAENFINDLSKQDEAILKSFKDRGLLVGVNLPRVSYSSETQGLLKALKKAKEYGVGFATVSNIGQVDLVKNTGLMLFGTQGLNVFNSSSLKTYRDMGFEVLTLSPELNSAQMRDIQKQGVKCAVVAKGTLELMVLENCIIRANGKCEKNNLDCCTCLHDRKGYTFKVGGQKRFSDQLYPCRNIVYNSVETDLLSKKDELFKTGTCIWTILI